MERKQQKFSIRPFPGAHKDVDARAPSAMADATAIPMSDRSGRRRVISFGLGGLVGALMLFGVSPALWLLYLAQALAGAFAAAVLPVSSAYVADMSAAEARARHFAYLSTGYGLGFLGGPALGGWLAGMEMSMPLSEAVKGGKYALPFFAAAGIATLAWLGVHFALPEAATRSGQRIMNGNPSRGGHPLLMLLLTLLVMFGLGAFEVSLTLQGQQNLGLAPREIALMFTECTLVMLVAQAVAFSPLVKGLAKHRLVFLGFAAMAAGLLALPQVSAFRGLMVFVGLVAAGAGILLPTLTYLVSIEAGQAQGAALGRQTAASSLGQGLGSALAGTLFSSMTGAPFWFSAGLLLIGSFIGLSAVRPPPLTDQRKEGWKT